MSEELKWLIQYEIFTKKASLIIFLVFVLFCIGNLILIGMKGLNRYRTRRKENKK